MDTLAHGLWGGVGFYRRGLGRFALAFLLGTLPDLLSFGIFHVTQPGWLRLRLAGEISGPPPLSALPSYVFHAYNLTHSLVLWGAVFALFWAINKKPPWLWLPWGLHILCDIPTHSSGYFPTPYLWPFPAPFVNGISWSEPWFMLSNYLSLLAAYLLVFLHARRKKDAGVKEK